jgi:cysteine synthase A
MIKVPDSAAFATIHFLQQLLNRKCGGSTGTNLYAAFRIISELHRQQISCSVVTMICDAGDRYLDTYYNRDWLRLNGFDITPYQERLAGFLESGMLEE